jgi:hypothetical protein
MTEFPLIPAKAGTQAEARISLSAQIGKAAWVPAFAGMSGIEEGGA